MRLNGAIRNKAKRGEMRRSLPVGLRWGEAEGQVIFHPDQEPDEAETSATAGGLARQNQNHADVLSERTNPGGAAQVEGPYSWGFAPLAQKWSPRAGTAAREWGGARYLPAVD